MDYGKIMSGDEGLWKLVSVTTRIMISYLNSCPMSYSEILCVKV